MIIIIGGLARETGKTTIAMNLAVNRAQRNQAVAILDCEPDQAATNWLKIRNRFGKEIGEVTPATRQIDVFLGSDDTADTLEELQQRYDHVLVDVGHRNLKALQSAIQVADKFYTPLQLDKNFNRMRISNLGEMLGGNYKVNPKMKSYAFANRTAFYDRWPRGGVSETVSRVWDPFECNCFKADYPIMEHDFIMQSSHIGLGVNEIPLIGLEEQIFDGHKARYEFAVLENHVFGDEPFMEPKEYFRD